MRPMAIYLLLQCLTVCLAGGLAWVWRASEHFLQTELRAPYPLWLLALCILALIGGLLSVERKIWERCMPRHRRLFQGGLLLAHLGISLILLLAVKNLFLFALYWIVIGHQAGTLLHLFGRASPPAPKKEPHR